VSELPPIFLEFKADISSINASMTIVQERLTLLEEKMGATAVASKEMGAKTMAGGMLMAQALTMVGMKAIHFAKDTVGKFGEVGGETLKMKRVLGGTAEEMSRLRFTGEELGVSTDQISVGMKVLSKNIINNSKNIQGMGVDFRDSSGKIKSTTQILSEVGDHFKTMPNGVQKTAEAVKLFGRSGTSLIPLLNQGSEGMKKFAEESDKLGLTMSQKDLDASRKFSLQTKEMHASLEGLQVTIGRAVVPALTAIARAVTAFLANNRVLVITILAVVTALGAMFLAMKISEAMMKLYEFRTKLMALATKAWQMVTKIATIATTAFSTVMGILSGEIALAEAPIWLVIAAIAALIEIFFFAIRHSKTFAEFLIKAIGFVGEAYGTVIKYILKGIGIFVNVFGAAAREFLKAMAMMAAPLKVLGINISDDLNNAAAAVDDFKNSTVGKLNEWADAAPAVGKRFGEAIGKGVVQAANFDVMGYLKSKFGGFGVDDAPALGDSTGGTGGNGAHKKKKTGKAISQALAIAKEINAAIALEDSKFKQSMAKNEQASFDDRLKIVKNFMKQNAKVIAYAEEQEKKTRGTKDHAAAVKALANATKEQAKMQTELNKINKEAAKALQDQADAQSRLMRLQQTASSWLQAHTAGLQAQNTGSVVVPVSIDGREVFRAVQKQSTQNSRRNISNGLTFTGATL